MSTSTELDKVKMGQPLGGALPVIQRPLDNTAISTYMACPQEYKYGMVDHMRTRGKSAPLSYGTLWHTMLEVHYKTGGNANMVRAAAEVCWKKEDHGFEGDHRTLERAWIDYLGYIKKWGMPHEEQGQTVGFPEAPLVEISVNALAGRLIHPYAGKLDRIIILNGLGYVEDHKTTSRLDKYYFSQFELSAQMMGYTYLAKHLFPNVKIVGVRINVLHLLKGASNYERQIVTFSPERLEHWAENTNNWMSAIAESTEKNQWLMHFGDNGCSRKFGMCTYHRVCSASPRVREKILTQEFDFNPWNPLEVEDAET